MVGNVTLFPHLTYDQTPPTDVMLTASNLARTCARARARSSLHAALIPFPLHIQYFLLSTNQQGVARYKTVVQPGSRTATKNGRGDEFETKVTNLLIKRRQKISISSLGVYGCACVCEHAKQNETRVKSSQVKFICIAHFMYKTIQSALQK